MRRHHIVAVVVLFLLGTAACAGSEIKKDRDEPGQAAGGGATQAATVAAAPSTSLTPLQGSAEPTERSISDLSDTVVNYIEGREGQVAVAVLLPETATHGSVIYTLRGTDRFRLASIVKVPIMLAVMAQAIEDQRDLTETELMLLTLMIRVSDNESASIFWEELGGGPAVEDYLLSIGIEEIFGHRSEDWGSSLGTAYEVAVLFGLIGFGSVILDQEMRGLALELLQDIHPEQSWGVTAADADAESGSIVSLKNGWYPDSIGWRVHSAAVIEPADGSQAYAIVVLTAAQPTKEYGIETIEEVARLIHAELRTQREPSPPPAQGF